MGLYSLQDMAEVLFLKRLFGLDKPKQWWAIAWMESVMASCYQVKRRGPYRSQKRAIRVAKSEAQWLDSRFPQQPNPRLPNYEESGIKWLVTKNPDDVVRKGVMFV